VARGWIGSAVAWACSRLWKSKPHAKNLIILALTFAALTIWSWRKWSDPVVDFGRELYEPWQITTGKILYRDIAVLFGPFSQYLNALWFTLFGVSVTTLVLCNLVILAAMTAGIYYLFGSACGPAAATVTTIVMLVLFGFSQYVSPGNYNFVCPYSLGRPTVPRRGRDDDLPVSWRAGPAPALLRRGRCELRVVWLTGKIALR
jgi:hypothetical protein